jgi:dienelactone hydrolase
MKRSMTLFLLAVMVMTWVAGCAQPVPSPTPVPPSPTPLPPTPTPPPSPFDYNASIPFDVKVNNESPGDGVTVTDLSYAGHDSAFSPSTGGRTLAYLVKPDGSGPFAGVIYLHWLGINNSNRGQYLDEAKVLAKRGAVCLLLQGYFPWMAVPRGTADDRQLIIGQIIELRRAIDFLLSQPGVDAKRLGYVGHDYGAVYGGALSGVDHRLKTYVLISGTPSFADWSAIFGGLDSLKRENYLPLVQDLDPGPSVAYAAPASIFFQFAKTDVLVRDTAQSFFDAASEPKKMEWYDVTGDPHEMISEAVRQARLTYLTEQLNLNTP